MPLTLSLSILLLPWITWMSLFAAFRSFLKQSFGIPVQSQNTLPLHPIMCAVHLSSNPFECKKCSGTDLWWWVLGLDPWAETLLGQLWDSPDCVSLAPSVIWVLICHFAVLLWAVKVGLLWADGSCDEPGRALFGPSPLALSLCSFVGVQISFYILI